jgi:hypothetical protein
MILPVPILSHLIWKRQSHLIWELTGEIHSLPDARRRLHGNAYAEGWSAVDAHGGKMVTDRRPQLPSTSTAQLKHDKPGRNSVTSKCFGCTADLRQEDPDAPCRPKPGWSRVLTMSKLCLLASTE